MAESFSVTRRYFDDKNYPRGFARHGDYTIREAQILEQYGQACLALETGERKAVTAEEKALCCRDERRRNRRKYHRKSVVKISFINNQIKTHLHTFWQRRQRRW